MLSSIDIYMDNFYVWMESFSQEEKQAANKTFRKWGFKSSLPPQKILPYVMEYLGRKPKAKVLDYGSGKYPTLSKYLLELGYDVTSHDFGDNVTQDHDVTAMQKKYDLVFASNVLNVQSSESMLKKTLHEIKKSLKKDGVFIANYPHVPRKLDLDNIEFMETIKEVFPKAKFDGYTKKGLLIFVNF